MNNKRLRVLGSIGAILLIFILIISNATFLTIDPGNTAVVFKRFSKIGLDKENPLRPGFYIIAPWNKVYEYNTREVAIEEQMALLSNNGLEIRVDITVRFRTDPQRIGTLHEEIGEGYTDIVVRPTVRSSVRKIIGKFNPEELYSTKRDEIQGLIEEELNNSLANKNIILTDALIRGIDLPDKVKSAIEAKQEAEQQALKYEYILAQEKQEAERKIIEAGAKAESNRILNASLSQNILRDKGIEATLELAKSPNSKIVIVGSGDDGLPLILGNN
jgi:regulator of protease activity HflC (stomatin/prohibitin superfamily)